MATELSVELEGVLMWDSGFCAEQKWKKKVESGKNGLVEEEDVVVVVGNHDFKPMDGQEASE